VDQFWIQFNSYDGPLVNFSKQMAFSTDCARLSNIVKKAENNLLRGAIVVCASIMLLLLELTRSATYLLASGTNDFDSNGASDVAPIGGVLNFRTAQLDDGTDPVGWYEKD
jgi:hypothetical protein